MSESNKLLQMMQMGSLDQFRNHEENQFSHLEIEQTNHWFICEKNNLVFLKYIE
jgi:hypothetical protein